jgi:membrane fusion protein (multidrug efflux system)
MENNEEKNQAPEKKKSFKRFIPLIVVILAVVVFAVIWYKNYSKYISTDDAHVDTDNVAISSKILGRIVHLYSEEGDTVTKGKLLAELDSSDLLSQRQQAQSMQVQAIASAAQAKAKYNYDQKSIVVLRINVDRANDDFKRAKEQFSGEVITKEQYEHAQKAMESAKAQLDAAQAQVDVSKAQVLSAEAAVKSSQSQIAVIDTQLHNTKLIAPFDGIIARRWLFTGDIVQPGQSVYTLKSDKKPWVAVYLEETKVTKIHLGQEAMFTVDGYPSVNFFGKVFYIGSNTASQFSLIPPNNASGNFTKITQRVPLKISIDSTDSNISLNKFNILSGMSAVIKIIKDR